MFPESGSYRAINRLLLGLGLPYLVRVEVQCYLFLQDRGPCKIASRCLVEILQPGLVRGKEHQGIAVEARRAAASFEDGACRSFRGIARFLAIRMFGPQDHETGIEIVRYILT